MQRKELTLSLISNITSRINSKAKLETLLSEIISVTKTVLNTEGCSLLLYDKKQDALVFQVSSGEKEESLSQLTVPRGKGIAGLVLETLQPEIVNDAIHDPRIFRDIDQKVGYQTRNLICVPMVAAEEVQGVLEAVNSSDGRDFNKSDIRILSYLSDLAAIAIRNRLLIDTLDLRARELDCLYQVSHALTKFEQLEDFLQKSVHTISQVLKVDRVAIFFEKWEESTEEKFSSKGFSHWLRREEYWNRILNDKEKFFQKGYRLLTPKEEPGKELSANGIFQHSMVFLPILKNKEWLGFLLVSDKAERIAFDESEFQIFKTLANQLGEALLSFQLKLQKAKLANLDRDMQTAAMIQRHSLPVIPKQFSLLEMETYYQASKEIGGDFYDYVIHGKDEVSIIIADVSGKGISAALFMELSKTILQGEVARSNNTKEALEKANRIIQEKSKLLMFVTAMLIRIQMSTKTLQYSSAGHNYQILYRKKLHRIEHLVGKGHPMGIDNEEYAQNSVSYEPGDLILLFTDGITEAMNEKQELFGEERLEAILLSHVEDSTEAIRQAIVQEVEAFKGNQEQHDDITLFLVRLN